MTKNTRGAINPITGLTEKEQQFALSFVANQGNVSASSKQIGLSRVTCTAYLKKQRVLDYIEALGESAGESVLTAQQVLEHLSKIATGEIKHELLNIKGEKVQLEDVHAKVNALKQLSRIYGMEKQVIEETKKVFVIGGDMESEYKEREYIDMPIDYLLEEGEENEN